MVQTPHFFSLVLDDSVQDMLIIPTSFLRVYGNHLSEKAFLKVPNGENWKIDVVRIGNNVWFGNGWKPFADFYSISYGSFLMFGFEDFQNSTFSVLIFDKSASEIDYPVHLQEEEDIDERSRFRDEQVGSGMKEENSEMDVFSISSEDESLRPSSSRRPRKEKKKKKKQENYRTQPEEKRDIGEFWNVGRKTNAVKIANAVYKPENPSFCIVMQLSYIVSTQLAVPKSFANKYFKQQRGFLSLKSVEGKTWSVEYINQEKYRFTIIRNGWSKFVKDNHLTVGDVCSFELLNPDDATELKFVICRENQIASAGNSKHSNYKDMSLLKDFISVNPYFTVKLLKCYLDHNFISIPAMFMAKFKNRRMEKAMLQVEKEEWPVKLHNTSSESRFKLSAGISRFFHDNALKVGDVCVFELINSETMLFKVSIFRNP